MATTDEAPLIVIVGPTASGKTALALDLAEKYGGEIVCADSRTVYKGMDIGTAKPTPEERRRVSHHLLDVVEPHENFSVAQFQRLAKEKIADIRSRGKVPFLVGGTGLYVDCVIFDYKFQKGQPDHRQQFQDMTEEELQNYCVKNNIELPENEHNKRYLIRAIEQGGVNRSRRNTPIDNCFIVGIATSKEEVRQRIELRSEAIFADNVVDEAIRLSEQYGWNRESMTGNVYRLIKEVQSGNITLVQAKDKFITLDYRLAKRQMTWLRRNQFIQWGERGEVARIVDDYLVDKKHAKIDVG